MSNSVNAPKLNAQLSLPTHVRHSVSTGRQARTILFVSFTLFGCLILQRFGIPFGGQSIPVMGPLGLIAAITATSTGDLSLSRGRVIVFLALLACVAIGEVDHNGSVVPYGVQISTNSILQFLGITSFGVFVFTEPMDEDLFFLVVNRFMIGIALAGIAQFVLQLVGVHIFSFADYLPASIMAEQGWNLQISFGIGELQKSNGFFLVEPSVMSQFTAIGISIEMLYFRRITYLATFGLALVMAESGTGELVLLGFLLAVMLRLGWRGMLIAGLLIAFAATIAGAVMLISPDMASLAQGRLNEFQTPGTSGHARFITPFWMLSDVLSQYPKVFLFGLGGGTSERITMPYIYDVNTPIKISVDYGVPAFICYFLLFITGDRTPRQDVLVFPALVLLMFTGGYQQFAPVVYFITLLICTASLKHTAASSPTKAARRV